jgi:hypothetical protein
MRIGCKLNARKLWRIVCWRFARVGCKRKNPPIAIGFHGNFLRVWVSKRLQELGTSEKKQNNAQELGANRKIYSQGLISTGIFLGFWR